MRNPHYTKTKNVYTLVIIMLTLCLAVSLFALSACQAKLTEITAQYLGGDLEIGQKIESSDVLVTANFSNGKSKHVNDYKLEYDTSVAGEITVMVSFAEGGATRYATFTVTVKEKQTDIKPDPIPQPALHSVSAAYNGGEVEIGATLSKADIVVTARYDDGEGNIGSLKTVINYELQYDFSSAGNKTVTVSYSENGVTKTTTFTVLVNEPYVEPTSALADISAEYTGEDIEFGGLLSLNDVTVIATYEDGSKAAVRGFEVSEFNPQQAGEQQVTIVYTENDVTKQCQITVTVKEKTIETANYGKYGILQDDGSIKVTNTAIVNGELQIHFLAFENNSPGDSIYIKAGDVDILIDAGSVTTSANTIAAYINNYVEDNKLEYVIATHSDADHIYAFVGSSGAQGILDRYQIDNIITYSAYYNNGYLGTKSQVQQNFENKCQALAQQGANLFTDVDCYNNAKEGAQRVYKLTDNIEMEILYNSYYTTKGSNNNNYSVCLIFHQYGEGYDFDNPLNPDNKNHVNHYLFTGDLEGTGETLLVQNNDLPEVVLFKAGHHGSETSSNEALLNVIKPKVVCVCTCCGEGRYGFPVQTSINRIAVFTDMVFMTNQNVSGRSYTHLNGNICVKSNEHGVFVNCSNNNILFKNSDWFKNNRTCPDEWKPSQTEPTE